MAYPYNKISPVQNQPAYQYQQTFPNYNQPYQDNNNLIPQPPVPNANIQQQQNVNAPSAEAAPAIFNKSPSNWNDPPFPSSQSAKKNNPSGAQIYQAGGQPNVYPPPPHQIHRQTPTPPPPQNMGYHGGGTLGDRTHIPTQHKPIFDILNNEFIKVRHNSQPSQKRMLDDTEKRLNILFDALNNEDISPEVIETLTDLVRALEARDYLKANNYQVHLMTTKMDECTKW
ncbi:4040_t:CDS:2 [Diversispora eburnea]|uniref:4040_t:CDS:1 n=1 Tax=Diversispora eburnea TaxID=1213867 RepID=A0A9N9F611_9GLOM|nr:4040_t:CDS:2 [Diversispora eburnea]